MRTLDQIGRDIREAKRRVAKLSDSNSDPKVHAAALALWHAREEFRTRAAQQLEFQRVCVGRLEEEWREAQKAKRARLHPAAAAWLAKHGRRWGGSSVDLKPKWYSEDGRWLVATRPGCKYWASLMEPSAYSEAWHMAFKTDEGSDWRARVMGGRLDGSALRLLKSQIKRIEEQETNQAKGTK